jgi:hypothetical protein
MYMVLCTAQKSFPQIETKQIDSESCHTCCNTIPRILQYHLKDRPLSRLIHQGRGIMDLFWPGALGEELWPEAPGIGHYCTAPNLFMGLKSFYNVNNEQNSIL